MGKTIKSARDLELQDGDEVVFVVDGETYSYDVCESYLHNNGTGGNSVIFDVLGIPNKEAFCKDAYGYKPMGGDWPEFYVDDYAALSRCVCKLFEFIEDRENKEEEEEVKTYRGRKRNNPDGTWSYSAPNSAFVTLRFDGRCVHLEINKVFIWGKKSIEDLALFLQQEVAPRLKD
jgi:hypothetical protein